MNHPAPVDIEAYVQTTDLAAIVSVLSSPVGELAPDPADPPDFKSYSNGAVILIVQPSEDGFLSVWLRGCNIWPSCAHLARYLSKQLACQARCDPGDEYPQVSPHSNIFLQVENGNESLVAWG